MYNQRSVNWTGTSLPQAANRNHPSIAWVMDLGAHSTWLAGPSLQTPILSKPLLIPSPQDATQPHCGARKFYTKLIKRIHLIKYYTWDIRPHNEILLLKKLPTLKNPQKLSLTDSRQCHWPFHHELCWMPRESKSPHIVYRTLIFRTRGKSPQAMSHSFWKTQARIQHVSTFTSGSMLLCRVMCAVHGMSWIGVWETVPKCTTVLQNIHSKLLVLQWIPCPRLSFFPGMRYWSLMMLLL